MLITHLSHKSMMHIVNMGQEKVNVTERQAQTLELGGFCVGGGFCLFCLAVLLGFVGFFCCWLFLGFVLCFVCLFFKSWFDF